tara:strand:+ start:403 stop:831 length:429 start_codon:yes stop_codon:yes gene_type:complete
MASITEVNPEKAIDSLAQELKKIKEIAPPEWAKFVKTGNHRERPPQNPDWWHIRAASVLKNVYKNGPVGVSKMRSRYGGRKNRGRKPERFTKSSGNILRKILQQLERANLVNQSKTLSKGRIISAKGQSLLDKTAVSVRSKK